MPKGNQDARAKINRIKERLLLLVRDDEIRNNKFPDFSASQRVIFDIERGKTAHSDVDSAISISPRFRERRTTHAEHIRFFKDDRTVPALGANVIVRLRNGDVLRGKVLKIDVDFQNFTISDSFLKYTIVQMNDETFKYWEFINEIINC